MDRQAKEDVKCLHKEACTLLQMGPIQRMIYTVIQAAMLVLRFGARPVQLAAARILRLVAAVATTAPSTL